MASPFSVFRENQKIMLVIVGLMAMIAFVFVPSWGGGYGGGRTGPDERVVTWKYGTLHESDIQRMQQWNQVLNQFLLQSVELATGGRIPLHFLNIPQFPIDEEGVVRYMLFTKKAEKMGLQVSDEAINTFINRATLDMARKSQLTEVLQNLRFGDRRISEGQLFDAFRNVLLAQNYISLVLSGVDGDPPGVRWDSYTKLNRTVTAETLAVPVADYIDQVPSPSETEVVAFFDRYKDRISQPELVQGVPLATAEPGFKIPYRAQFQYFKADREVIYQQILAENKFTEEEIQKYYDQNKSQYRVPVTTNPAAPTAGANTAPETSAAPAGEATTESPAGEATTSAPAGEATTDGSAAEAAPSETSEIPGETPAEPNATPAETDGSSATSQDSETLLALADEDVLLAQASDANDSDTDAAAPTATEPTATDGSVEAPADPAAAEGAAPAGQASADATEETAAPPAGESTSAPNPPSTQEPQIRSLDEVREQVKQDIARLQVNSRITEGFNKIQTELANYNDRVVRHTLESETDTKAPAPAEPDFAALAKQLGMTFVDKTPMMSAIDATRDPQFPSDQRFIQEAFNEQLQTYRAITTSDVQGNSYLVWKTDSQPSRVPSLDDVRSEVVRAWKLEQARPIALKEAEARAEEVRTKKALLKDVFGDRVVTVGPFTAATLGNVPGGVNPGQQPQLTRLPQLDNAGPQFMDVVTRLQQNEVGVAFNQPETVVYVVQVVSAGDDAEFAREQFAARAATNFNSFAQVSTPAKQRAFQEWVKRQEEEADLRWLRAPRPFEG